LVMPMMVGEWQPKVILLVYDGENAGHRLRVRRVTDTILACAMLDRTKRHVDRTRKCEIGDVVPPTVEETWGPLVAVRGAKNTHGLAPFFGRVRPRHVPML